MIGLNVPISVATYCDFCRSDSDVATANGSWSHPSPDGPIFFLAIVEPCHMYSMVQLEHVDGRDLDEQAPVMVPLGEELEAENLGVNVWKYERGETNAFHRHERQEELYVILEGTIDLTVERGEERDVLELRKGDAVIVAPESWRQFEARDDATVIAVGAPKVDDGIVEE